MAIATVPSSSSLSSASESPPRPAARHTRKPEGSRNGRTNDRDEAGDLKRVGQWQIGKTIGKGSSGRVKIARHRITGQLAAVKIIPKHVLNSCLGLDEAAKVRKQFSNEQRLLSSLFTL
jgi:serine/threonine protein kinase